MYHKAASSLENRTPMYTMGLPLEFVSFLLFFSSTGTISRQISIHTPAMRNIGHVPRSRKMPLVEYPPGIKSDRQTKLPVLLKIWGRGGTADWWEHGIFSTRRPPRCFEKAFPCFVLGMPFILHLT